MDPARLVAALAIAGAAAAPQPPASAATYAGTWRSGIATFALTGQDGRAWQLSLQPAYTTAVSTSNHRNVVIKLTQCTGKRCSYSRTWQADLGAADLTEATDGGTFTVKASLGGTPFSATWVRGSDTSETGSVTGTSATLTVSHSAKVTLDWGRLSCDARPDARTYETTAVTASEPFSPGPKEPAPPRGLLGPRLRCA